MPTDKQIETVIDSLKPTPRETAEKIVFLSVNDGDTEWVRLTWKAEIDAAEALIIGQIENALRKVL